MTKLSDKVKSYFKEVNTTHTKWVLRNGSKVDLTSDNISDKDMRQLSLDNPALFVVKDAQKAPAPTAK